MNAGVVGGLALRCGRWCVALAGALENKLLNVGVLHVNPLTGGPRSRALRVGP